MRKPVSVETAEQEFRPAIEAFRAGIGRRLPRGYTRIAALMSAPAALRDCGVSPDELTHELGLPASLFDHPDNAIPYEAACAFLARCVRETGRDDFSLMVCDRVGPSGLGLIGFLLQHATDVRTALFDLVRYLHHTDRGASAYLKQAGGVVTLGYSIFETDAPGCAQIYDCALAVGRNIMRSLCGPGFSLIEASLSHKASPSPARYERFFGCPVRFDAEQNALYFDEKWLDVQIAVADAALRQMLQEQIDMLEAEEACSFAEQVRRLLRAILVRRPVTLEDVRKLLRLPRRTFARRLAAEGASYHDLTNEIMFEIARQLLSNPARSVTDVALSLHFSEASAFSRAFRQWSGVSPSQWRMERQRRGEGAKLEALV